MDDGFKVAVASSDGHVTPVCEGGEHDEDRLDRNLQELSDCRYLLVARIGSEAYLRAEHYGIESYELPGLIDESIDRLIKFIKIQNLFTKKG